MIISRRTLSISLRLASLPLLAAMVLTFLSVFSDTDFGIQKDCRPPVASMQSGSNRQDGSNSLAPEHVMKLSWVSIGYAGQTICGAASGGRLTVPERTGTDTSVHGMFPGRDYAFWSTGPVVFNLLAGDQIFVLRIARLKAG